MRERAPEARLRPWTLGGVAVTASTVIASCAPSCVVRAPSAGQPIYTYTISPPPGGSFLLAVEATLEQSPSDRLVAPEGAGSMPDAMLVGKGGGSPLGRAGDTFVAPACRIRCTIRYTVDLGDLASSCRGMDCERKVGDSVLGRASNFMLRPETAGDAMFEVNVVGPNKDRFATGLQGGNDHFFFPANALGEASYTAFGAMRRGTLDLAGARLDVVFLGAPLGMGDAAALEFVRQSALRIASLFGFFPIDATVFVVPVPGAREVVFGRVLSLAGASVALLFGDDTPASGVQDNWVVVHELFHLGCPSFAGGGRWLEEGLATYYEPILRARAGWMTEAALWSHFVREMPRGLRQSGDPPGLEDRDDIDSTYWGGALFALLADVRSRAATGNQHSLDDVIRALRQRVGGATKLARLADFLSTAQEATGAREVGAVYDSWALRGENVDLDALWTRLGVAGLEEARSRGSLVTLRDDAPLASVRRAIAASEFH